MKLAVLSRALGVFLLSQFIGTMGHAQGVTSEFTYQGRLVDGGVLANGIYDMQFRVFDASEFGSQVGSTLFANNVGIIDGIVTIELNFGSSVFSGSQRWLEIGIRPGASVGDYTILSPRQPITAAPYAMFALDIPGGRIPSGAVMYFNLASCPDGWTELNAGRGRYIVGFQPGETIASTVGTALGVGEDRPVGQHTHDITDPGHTHTDAGHKHWYEQAFPNSTGSGNSQAGYNHAETETGYAQIQPSLTGITIDPAGAVAGTNAPYILLLVCQKD